MTRRKKSIMVAISSDTMKALHRMDEQVHQPAEKEPVIVRSVFAECPCLTCIDGGIDMPHCAECDPMNGFAYFRKKV